jgi:hypothetical protein
LRAIQDARVGAAEADQRPDHFWIVERECPCHEASPIVADQHEAVVPENHPAIAAVITAEELLKMAEEASGGFGSGLRPRGG